MTVHPGFGGQDFIPEVLEKIAFARDICDKLNIRKGGVVPKKGESLPPFDIEVDGGINPETAKRCIKAGANIIVAGTYAFSTPKMSDAVKILREPS